MSNLVDFLTSTEIIVVYIVTLVTILLCLIIYLFDKGAERRKQKQNTKELNRIVVEEEPTTETQEEVQYAEEPILVESSVSTIETSTINDLKEEEPEIEELVIDDEAEEILTYTNIEPNKEEATAELMKLTETLEKSLNEAEQDNINISVQKYEEDQEKDAIISYDELLQRTRELNLNNEVLKVEDNNEKVAPVIIKEATDEDIKTIENTTYTEEQNTEHKFKSSPIISPVYGISNNEIEIENTANFDKLDAELLKSNLFLDKLKKFKENNNYDR